MINASQSRINQASVHIVGNRSREEALELSEQPLALDDEKVNELLLTYFLSNFKTPEFHSFTFSNEDFALNPIYQFASEIFSDNETLHVHSINMAKHLFEASQHPNIKAGDFYVAHIEGVNIENTIVDAIGIFKSENKDTYLKLKASKGNFKLNADEGTNIKKLDKGCLILNLESEAGYKILLVDNANQADAQFWRQNFLNVKPWSDAFHHTHNFMNLTKQYVADQLDEEFSVSKADQIDLLNRSMNFFKSREQFDQREFEVEVLADADVIQSFRKFEKNFGEEIIDSFEISVHAVKRQARIFKSVLKLDKNFHIYIHGNRELIEKGYDEARGEHFYKIYFKEES